jgi:hypothetical protein
MLTPNVREITTPGIRVRRIPVNAPRITRPVPSISAPLRDWEHEIYDADPTGGNASAY